MPDSWQQHNVVGGDQAGRDINKSVIVARRPTTISALHERLKAEIKADSRTRELVEALQHYANPQDNHPLGLDEKLAAGHREHWRLDAVHLKERFAKRLLEHNLSESAQQILLYALTRAHLFFRTHVQQLIDAGAPDQAIREALTARVVTPVLEELEDNLLNLMADEIEGIVWFLTGNCFIRWTPRA